MAMVVYTSMELVVLSSMLGSLLWKRQQDRRALQALQPLPVES